jgi:3-oxoacyl-[acyl-carrier-protein] synthase-3
MNSSNTSYALLLCGDTSAKDGPKNKEVKHTNTSKLLFGNSGTATLLYKSEQESPMTFISRTDGSGFRKIIAPYGGGRHPDNDAPEKRGTRFDDMEIFNFTIDEVPIMLKELMDVLGKTPNDYDSLALHQANRFIIQQVGKRAGFSEDKILVSLDKYGNTSSASIPLTLVNQYGDQDGDKELSVLSCGFGIGLSWAATEMKVNTNNILPIIHTDDYFDDGYPFDE